MEGHWIYAYGLPPPFMLQMLTHSNQTFSLVFTLWESNLFVADGMRVKMLLVGDAGSRY